jgi:undecaprenyl-diphosphatase
MSFFESIILGIIQALTEFFPISSSAHLKIASHFLHAEENILLDLSCHLGTLGALLVFLHKDIMLIIKHSREKLLLLFSALIPLVPCYFLLKPFRVWASSLHLVGFFLIATGLILLAGQYLSVSRSQNRKLRDSLIIGAAQSMALIPGISRSASTISCAKILGWEAKEAVRFSFLLSIPTIVGGNIWEFAKKASSAACVFPELSGLIAAFISSFLIGLLLVPKAIRWLEKGNLRPCAWYCFILGAFAVFYFNR